jgi:hypothetical protein
MTAQEHSPHLYTVGDIVRTAEPFGPNPAGRLGVVYETYPDQAPHVPDVVSILLTNGHDIGSFNAVEQAESLILLGHTELSYPYSSPGQLMIDYRNGLFAQAFADAQRERRNR